jgi:hypothetical protein
MGKKLPIGIILINWTSISLTFNKLMYCNTLCSVIEMRRLLLFRNAFMRLPRAEVPSDGRRRRGTGNCQIKFGRTHNAANYNNILQPLAVGRQLRCPSPMNSSLEPVLSDSCPSLALCQRRNQSASGEISL